MPTILPTFETCAGPAPVASVIWLHGLGADGHDFAPIVGELNLPDSLPLRFVFPHAPRMPVTLNGGYVMPAWYDVAQPDLTQREDETGIRASQHAIEQLIEREQERGIPAARILLAGFSQGGAIALQTGLRYAKRLAGILALSTYVPLRSSVAAEASLANRDIPIFMAHGMYDNVIPVGKGLASRDLLSSFGYPVVWREYAMAHAVCPEEIRDIGAWLCQVLAIAAVDD